MERLDRTYEEVNKLVEEVNNKFASTNLIVKSANGFNKVFEFVEGDRSAWFTFLGHFVGDWAEEENKIIENINELVKALLNDVKRDWT